MRFKIDWASLIVERKFTVFALFYFVLEGNFPSISPPGAYVWRGDLTEGFLRYRLIWGLIFGGAYLRNFTVTKWHEPGHGQRFGAAVRLVNCSLRSADVFPEGEKRRPEIRLRFAGYTR